MSTIPATSKQSIDGVTFGAVVGYDAPVGDSLRLGAEASFSGSTAGRDFDNDSPTVFNLGNVKADQEIYVGGRVGVVTSPSTMIYAKGGYTNQRYSVTGSNGTVTLDQKLDTDGWRAGAGAEFAVGRNAYIGAEYRYSNYGEGEVDFEATRPTAAASTSTPIAIRWSRPPASASRREPHRTGKGGALAPPFSHHPHNPRAANRVIDREGGAYRDLRPTGTTQ